MANRQDEPVHRKTSTGKAAHGTEKKDRSSPDVASGARAQAACWPSQHTATKEGRLYGGQVYTAPLGIHTKHLDAQ
jgi:hypothetical protein